jgi:cytoskeletal protein CcmA (bactofilin family)
VVSVLIAILVFAFISLIFVQQKLHIKNNFYKEAIQNVLYGFDYSATQNIPYDQVQAYTFSENKLENTSLLKQHWGVFDLLTVTSTVKNEMFQKVGLLGGQYIKRDALFLKDNNHPLVLVGETKIIGNASLPKSRVKTGYIAGESYHGNRLIYGNEKQSTETMPTIQNIAYIKNLIEQNFHSDSIAYFELEDGLQKKQSFTQPIAYHYTNSSISLKNIALQGNIVIQSNSSIQIDASATIEDVIFIAPKVEISTKVKGNFQVFASKKITVAKNCSLNYPSALVVMDKNKTKNNTDEDSGIFIDENSTIKGVIVYKNTLEENKTNFRPQLTLSEKSTVTGEVYCNQNIELLGSVLGTVYTHKFIVKKFGSVYINHIYNGTINSKKLPQQYSGLLMDKTSLKVAKWVY